MKIKMKRTIYLPFCVFLIFFATIAFTESWEKGKITFWSNGSANIMNADGTAVTKLMDVYTFKNLSFSIFSLSPDCRKVTFVIEDIVTNIRDIVVFELDSSKLINLTNGSPPASVNPRWSPDGKKIAIISYELSNYIIQTMNSDGSNPQIIYKEDDKGIISLDWSPNGGEIAFTEENDIYTIDISSERLRRVTDGQFLLTEELTSLRWSPDGEKFLFIAGDRRPERKDRKLYIVNIDGSNLKMILSEDGDNIDNFNSCCWSPDAQKIALSAEIRPEKQEHIWVMNSDGSNIERLTNNDFDEYFIDWRESAFFVSEISSLIKTIWGNIKTVQ